MSILSLILLVLLALIFFLILFQRGGMVESLVRLQGGGAKLVITAVILVLLGVVAHRSFFYMTPEREGWIVQGRTRADSVSLGFNTKSRFRSLSQPLGRVMDRNGKVLAGYDLVNGHLVRNYPEGATTAHVVGYWTGPIRDGVGIEKAMTLINDSLKDDRPHDLKLTLDIRLQRDAMRALAGQAGAIVVMDPSNGEVLAAADYPSYDPNRITSDSVWRRLVTDVRNRPLISRALRDNFSPGSSIKPFIAAAAALSGAPLPEQRGFVCTSAGFTPGRGIKPITDHGAAHGRVDIYSAMRVSCNVYFSYLAYDLVGYQTAKAVLDSLGYDQRLRWNTGAFLNLNATLLPVNSWVIARDEIAKTRLGIGQASVKVNALHVATLMSGLANGGLFLRPTLELGRTADTLPWNLDGRAVEWVDRLLREPLMPGGTAARAFAGIDGRGFTVYGKTGTADPEPDGRNPSWFISFAEKNGRRYVVVVVIQNRGRLYAGDINAPMTRKMYEALDSYGYFAALPEAPRPRSSRGSRPAAGPPASRQTPVVVDTIRTERPPQESVPQQGTAPQEQVPTTQQPTSPTEPANPPPTEPQQSPEAQGPK